MSLIEIDALVALRLAMKYKETQVDMYAEPLLCYQKVYDALVSKIWGQKAKFFGSSENGYGIENWSTLSENERVTQIEEKINTMVQLREY